MNQDTEIVIWGIPPNEDLETLLYTLAESKEEAERIAEKLEKYHGCTKTRVQVFSGYLKPDFADKRLLNI